MNSAQSNTPPRKLLHVDGLRGVACLMVVLSHLALIFYPGLHDPTLINNNSIINFIFNSPLSFIYSGTAAVYIFFTLSGYILTHAFLSGGDMLNNATTMTTKRYFRLAIPATASCIFCWLVLSNETPGRELLSAWIQSYTVASPSFLNALYSGAVSAFFGDGSAYNPVLWTMKIELLGSFLTYFICLVLIRAPNKGLIILLFCIMFFVSSLPQKEKYGYIAFLFGSFIHFSGLNLRKGVALILMLAGLYLGGVHYGSRPYIYAIYYTRFYINGEESNAYILYNFISGVLITLAILTNNSLKMFFAKKPFVYMGKVSFSVYLFHLPFFLIIATGIFNAIYNAGYSYHESAITATILSIVTIYAVANLIFKAVDNPSMRFSSILAKFLFKTPTRIS
ncbi:MULTISPECIES: acyltransferase family protein [Franconibacter]|nr:acyltransferase [Franconibacter pulveris]